MSLFMDCGSSEIPFSDEMQRKMTHLPRAWQVYCLILWHFFYRKIHFFSFFNALRHGIGTLAAQYSFKNFKTKGRGRPFCPPWTNLKFRFKFVH